MNEKSNEKVYDKVAVEIIKELFLSMAYSIHRGTYFDLSTMSRQQALTTLRALKREVLETGKISEPKHFWSGIQANWDVESEDRAAFIAPLLTTLLPQDAPEIVQFLLSWIGGPQSVRAAQFLECVVALRESNRSMVFSEASKATLKLLFESFKSEIWKNYYEGCLTGEGIGQCLELLLAIYRSSRLMLCDNFAVAIIFEDLSKDSILYCAKLGVIT